MTGKQVKDKLYQMGVKLGRLAEDMGMTSQNFSAALKSDNIKSQFLEDIARALGRDMTMFYGEPATNINSNNTAGRDIKIDGKHIDRGLKEILPVEPYCRLTTYWARHSWATIAYNQFGASVDLISAALGHQHGSRVTQVYINPDQRRVDELNRRILDLIFADFSL